MGRANRGKDTGPELALRSALHRRGLRYRVHRRVERAVRTSVDIAFGPSRVAVFVNGCFWHRCPIHGTVPKANREWWLEKLERNVQRDRHNDAALAAHGWTVIRVWEHEDIEQVADEIATVVRSRRVRATTSE